MTLTVPTVPKDFNERKAQSHMRPLTLRNLMEEGAEKIGNSQNEGITPPPPRSPSRRVTKPVCGGVEVYNQRSLRVKYRSPGVQTSAQNHEEKRSPQGPDGSGNARANIPDANRSASGFSRILFKCFPGKSSEGWHPVTDLKQLNAHIFCTSLAHYKLTNLSRQQEVPMFCLQKTRYISSEYFSSA